MQLKPKDTANTEPAKRPHSTGVHAGPGSKNEEKDKGTVKEDADSKIRPDDFDVPKENVIEKDTDDEKDKIEEAKRPG